MNKIAIVLCEFLKEARAWEDMSYDDQKAYLKRHPKTKRRLTARPESGSPKADDEDKIKSDDGSTDTYAEFAKKLTDKSKSFITQRVKALQDKMDARLSAAIRREQRGDFDGTAIEAASDRNRPLEIEQKLLKHYLEHGNAKLPKELQAEFDEHKEHQKYQVESKAKRSEEKEKYDDLVGKNVTWKSRKRFGQEMTARVVAVKAGKHGVYVKTNTGWKVPVRLITKTKQLSKEEQSKVKDVKPSDLIGKTVTWKTKYRPQHSFRRIRFNKPMRVRMAPPGYDSATGTAGGIVESVKGSKVIVGGWRIPLSLIKKVNGKDFAV